MNGDQMNPGRRFVFDRLGGCPDRSKMLLQSRSHGKKPRKTAISDSSARREQARMFQNDRFVRSILERTDFSLDQQLQRLYLFYSR